MTAHVGGRSSLTTCYAHTMSSPPFDIPAFLGTPMTPASVAAVGRRGGPALGSLWFRFDERRFWFTTRAGRSPLLRAAQHANDVAVMVEVFEPPDLIRLVRATGPARIEKRDPARIEAIYKRYLGDDLSKWPEFFRQRVYDSQFILWSALAARGLAVSFPRFQADELRWSEPGQFLDRKP